MMKKNSIVRSGKLENQVMAAFDIGGTNTRVQVIQKNNLSIDIPLEKDIFELHISSKGKLKKLIQELVFIRWKKFCLKQCVLDFAGPVLNHQSVRMSNWKGSPVIKMNELIEWGLPRNCTLMINDIEAASFGILSLIETNQLSSAGCSILYEPDKPVSQIKQSNNMILLMPGTGLGTAGLVSIMDKTGMVIYKPIASEIGHAPASPINQIHEDVIRWLKNEKIIKYDWPSWEDFVSGRGLVHIYEALVNITNPLPSEIIKWKKDEDGAPIIARAAIQQMDKLSEKALELFFRCTGKIAQILALAYQPFGGIFLCGGVIRKNQSFIPESGFLEELHGNAIQSNLLKMFPVYVVTKKNLNIIGNLWAARNQIKGKYLA